MVVLCEVNRASGHELTQVKINIFVATGWYSGLRFQYNPLRTFKNTLNPRTYIPKDFQQGKINRKDCDTFHSKEILRDSDNNRSFYKIVTYDRKIFITFRSNEGYCSPLSSKVSYRWMCREQFSKQQYLASFATTWKTWTLMETILTSNEIFLELVWKSMLDESPRDLNVSYAFSVVKFFLKWMYGIKFLYDPIRKRRHYVEK